MVDICAGMMQERIKVGKAAVKYILEYDDQNISRDILEPTLPDITHRHLPWLRF